MGDEIIIKLKSDWNVFYMDKIDYTGANLDELKDAVDRLANRLKENIDERPLNFL